jgi:hypothetical protein
MLCADDYEKMKFVRDTLGPTVTAALSGTRNRGDVAAWFNAHKTPDVDQLKRLRFASEIFAEVSKTEGPDMTRSWFMGANVGDDCDSPITAIREGRFEEVRISATRMIEEQSSS